MKKLDFWVEKLKAAEKALGYRTALTPFKARQLRYQGHRYRREINYHLDYERKRRKRYEREVKLFRQIAYYKAQIQLRTEHLPNPFKLKPLV